MLDRLFATPRWSVPTLAIGRRDCVLLAIAVTAFHAVPFANKYVAHLIFGRHLESDFYSFYFAADAVFNHGPSPYSLEVVRYYERVLNTAVYPFLYPPTALPWLAPFSLFSADVSLLMSQAASLASLAALAIVLQQHVVARIESTAWRFILVGALFAFDSIAATVAWAQINRLRRGRTGGPDRQSPRAGTLGARVGPSPVSRTGARRRASR